MDDWRAPDGRIHERLDYQPITKLFHQLGDIIDVTTQAAVFFGDRERQPAHFGKTRPVFPGKPISGIFELATFFENVPVADVALGAVGEHFLFFSRRKVHSHSPKASLAIMFFCTSMAPPKMVQARRYRRSATTPGV